jgi:GNAT superfamily N-acetyltransferase
MNAVTIRAGRKGDLTNVLQLVKELAEYERAPHEVINNVALMERDGFGPTPVFSFFVAETSLKIIGISLYYYRYSTWKGKRLYLEDIIVTAQYRGQGIGKLLFEQTMLKAVEDNCNGMSWQALDWNEPALNFYRKYGAKLEDGWLNGSLEPEQIHTLLNGSKAAR